MNVFVSSLIGEHYVTHSFSQSGDVQWFTIAALNDNTQVTVQRPGAEIPDSSLDKRRPLPNFYPEVAVTSPSA